MNRDPIETLLLGQIRLTDEHQLSTVICAVCALILLMLVLW